MHLAFLFYDELLLSRCRYQQKSPIILAIFFFFFLCVYLHEKHIKKFGFKFRKTRPNRQVTEKKRKHICIQKDNEITVYFSHRIHAQFYLNKVLQFFT